MRQSVNTVLASLFALFGGVGLAGAVNVQVGVSTPMQKVMIAGQIKGWPFEPYEGTYSSSYNLSLARNEHEGFQVTVIPDANLTNARVTVSTLQPQGHSGVFNGTVSVWLVGHVKGAAQPRSDLNIEYPTYLVNYNLTDSGGWWPDPLLTFTNTCSITANNRVSYWVDVATKADTPAGNYTATVTVQADGITAIPLQLSVHVWDFALPAKSTLPTAFSIDSLWQASWLYGTDWSSTIENKYLQMQQDHRLSVAEIYSWPRAPSWHTPWLALNNAFCLSMVTTSKPNPAGLATLYSYFMGLDRLNEAYVYGYDEVTSEKYAEMRDTFNAIHENYPGLRTMTTARDNSFGTAPNSTFLREAVDIWVPIAQQYKMGEAEKLRAEGKDMWWYVCDYPRHPIGANWLLEYPAIEARLLLGAMTFKYKAGGFLYYSVTHYGYRLWSDGLMPRNTPIQGGPYTGWDARVAYYDAYNGYIDSDGCIYYPGPVSVGPLPSIRSQNIRDGLEDYEYLHMLKSIKGQVACVFPPGNTARDQYIAQADALLAVPSDVVNNLTTSGFTRDPAVLYAFRAQVADKILAGRTLLAGHGELTDTDGDGVFEPCDNCPTNYNPEQLNADGDSLGNICDPDDDNDGVADGDDNCPLVANAGQEDGDSDGVGNVCDNCPDDANPDQKDGDEDGHADACDNCPKRYNPDQADTGDSDGVGDVCDNCPTTPNLDQADDDEDGLGNVCDSDPSGATWLSEHFDGMLSGADKIGSWDQTAMLARWPLTYGSSGGTFTTGSVMDPDGGVMDTNKTPTYRMTANLETDMSATYGVGNSGIGAGNAVNGTDDKPLILEFAVHFGGEAAGMYSNFYVELSNDDGSGDDQAPRQGMTTEDADLSNGDQGPWRAPSLHRCLAFGSFAAVNQSEGYTGNYGTKGAPCYFDGQRWFYAKAPYATDVNGDPVSLFKSTYGGVTIFKMVVKTDTITLQLTNLDDTPLEYGPNEFARAYKGGFNRISLTLGNLIVTAGRSSFVDEVEVRNGDLSPVPPTSVSADRDQICAGDGGTIALTATGGTGTTLRWFDDVCGGHDIGTGSPLTIRSPEETTTYHVRCEKEYGSSSCASVTVTVNPLPGLPADLQANPPKVVAGESASLSATAGSDGDTVEWFTGSCGGEEVADPASVTLMETTTFYARTKNAATECVSTSCAELTVPVYEEPCDPAPWCGDQAAKLTATDAAASDCFGEGQVAVSGDVAIIGAWGDDDSGDRCGAAYAFRFRGPSGWVQEDKLLPGSCVKSYNEYYFFGTSVAVSGDVAVVGARGDEETYGYRSGAAYVYRRGVSGWVQEAKLKPTDGAANDQFGQSVGIDGDTIVIGAVYDSYTNPYGTPLAFSGSAYVFRREGTAWIQRAKLIPSDGADRDHFGDSLAIFGDAIAVGSPDDDDRGTSSGSAYVFVKPAEGWHDVVTESAKLLAGDGAGWDWFGRTRAVAISGDTVAVGAFNHGNSGWDYDDGPGAAYVFVKPAGGWATAPRPKYHDVKLTASDGALEDWLGKAVAISGDTIVAGSRYNNDTGAAYVFAKPGPSWPSTMNESVKLVQADDDWVRFADSVAIDGGTVMVGAGLDDDKAAAAGATYVFDVGDQDCDCSTVADVCELGLIIDCDLSLSEVEPGSPPVIIKPINPGSDSEDRTENALVAITNETGGDGATIIVKETEVGPPMGGYFEALGNTLRIDTSLLDGEYRMTVSIPFDRADLRRAAGLPDDKAPCDEGVEINLMWLNPVPSPGHWELAVLGNKRDADAPGLCPEQDPKPGAQVGCWRCSEPTVNLGDYGVYWDPVADKGYVWANLDHASDFAAVITVIDGDLDGDGEVGASDFAIFLAAFGHSEGEPAYDPRADYDADGIVTFVDYQTWLSYYRAAINNMQAWPPLEVLGDFQPDGHVDGLDLAHFNECFTGPAVPQDNPDCQDADLDRDGDVDQSDFGILQRCMTGPTLPVDLSCTN